MVHALAILYSRWSFPAAFKESNPEALEQLEAGLSVSVQKDLDWLEAELEKSTGNFLVGNDVTAADVMMHFSVQFALARQLGTKSGKWEKLQAWLDRCEGLETYKTAVRKSGYTLHPHSI